MKRPQPSLLMMLASGYTPVYAAHIPPAQYRTGCIGTGPFKLKEWRRGEFVEYVKNPDYFVKGRPYLDGLKYVVIVERGTRTAALQAGQLDAACPGETSKTTMEQLKKAVPQMVFHTVAQDVTDNIIMNIKKPPFDNPKVRLAVSYAIDRRGLIQASHQGGAILGAAMLPRPFGVWGMSDKDLLALPGYGKADEMKAPPRSSSPRPGSRRTTAQGRDGDARHRDLRGHGLLRHQRAEAGRDRRHAQAGGDGPVASDGHARRVPDRRRPRASSWRARRYADAPTSFILSASAASASSSPAWSCRVCGRARLDRARRRDRPTRRASDPPAAPQPPWPSARCASGSTTPAYPGTRLLLQHFLERRRRFRVPPRSSAAFPWAYRCCTYGDGAWSGVFAAWLSSRLRDRPLAPVPESVSASAPVGAGGVGPGAGGGRAPVRRRRWRRRCGALGFLRLDLSGPAHPGSPGR